MNGKRDYTPRPKTFTPPKQKTAVKSIRTDDTGKLRKKLDEVFSKFIRGMSKKCFTCDTGKNEHCGHFMKRGNDSTRWDKNNARPQCWRCNIELGGNFDVFREKLIYEIGIENIEELEDRARIAIKFSAPELQEMIEKYSNKRAA